MTLTEAISSGKRFGRRSDALAGEYFTAEEFEEAGIGLDDVSATDYELEPEATGKVSVSSLVKAWNASRVRSNGTPRTGIAVATGSEFFKEFLAHLAKTGVSINKDVNISA